MGLASKAPSQPDALARDRVSLVTRFEVACRVVIDSRPRRERRRSLNQQSASAVRLRVSDTFLASSVCVLTTVFESV